MNEANVLTAANGQYVEPSGIERMFSDLSSYIYPIFSKSNPLLYALAKISFIIIPLIFLALLFFAKYIRKHRLADKLKKKGNYYAWGIMLALYFLTSIVKFNFGYGFIFGFDEFILPAVAKFFGPLVACIFAVLQYVIIAVKTGAFNPLLLIVAATSGIAYGLFFYRRKTRYTTCISGCIVVRLVCAVFLTQLVTYDSGAGESIAAQLTYGTIYAVLTSPIEAAVNYAVFKTVRLVKNHLNI